MKSKRPNSLNKTCKTAYRVSAAALMLGVSHAATVGFNFQCNYNGYSGSYSGAYVTAPAFGIGTNGWESLTQMGTGYGTTVTSPLMLTIDSTTSSDGLNPLPNGTLNITWSGSSANVSGFGGYDSAPPHYTYAGNGHKPGEQEVYWGFLRDGVNFGPGQSGGDNNVPGWTVDITGLKSVFTNSPFVVEMIGAGDSIENLTNVFIVDAALSTTQSVSYPNIPPISNVGDTPWPRGIGGGLSTGSGAVDTDHLQIFGNRAQHSAGPPAFNNASQVAGFIITDKPVITMSPQSVLISPGDVVTLRAIAIGVPPLSLQWRNNGVDIPGATNSSYVISNAVTGAGNYDLAATNNYGFAISTVAAVTLDQLNIASGPGYTMDSNPSGPRHDAEVLGATILASSTDSLGTNRMGVAHFVAIDPDQIVVPTINTTDLDATNCTITFWMRFSGTVNASKETILFDRRTTSGVIIAISELGTIGVQDSDPNSVEFYGSTDVTDNNWHYVAVVNDNVNGLQIYVDGILENEQGSPASWTWPAGQQMELGLSHSSSFVPYNGDLDDFRFYNRNLTGTEVATVYNTDAVVDSTALKLWLNFSSTDLNPGIKVSWQNTNAILQSAGSITGPWNNLPTATSPFSQETGSAQTFFRYIHTPVTFESNPYDM